MAVRGVYATVPADDAAWGPPVFSAKTVSGQTVTLSPVDGTAALTRAGLHAPDWVPVGLGLRVDGGAGPVAFVRRSWTGSMALTAAPPGADNARWSLDPAGLVPAEASPADRVRTTAGDAPATVFFPRLYVDGGAVSNGYAAFAGEVSRAPRAYGQAYTPVENARALCAGPSVPGGCRALMQEYCGDPGGPNFGGAECVAWGQREDGGEAMDEAARAWCRGRPEDARCRCVRSEDAGEECENCQGATDAGRQGDLLATRRGLAARDGVACALKKTLAEQGEKRAADEAAGEAGREQRARQLQATVEGYQSTQTLPLWAWLVLVAAVISCVAVFLRQTRGHVEVRVEETEGEQISVPV